MAEGPCRGLKGPRLAGKAHGAAQQVQREEGRLLGWAGEGHGWVSWASGGLGVQLKTSVKDSPPSRFWVLVEAQHLHCGEIQGGNQLGGQQVLGV